MPNRNYNKGRAYEYKIKKRYEKLGYTVFRSAGSHSPADLVAVCPVVLRAATLHAPQTEVIFIQCKTSKKTHCLVEDIEEFHQWARSLGCLGRFFVKGPDGETCYDSDVVYDALQH